MNFKHFKRLILSTFAIAMCSSVGTALSLDSINNKEKIYSENLRYQKQNSHVQNFTNEARPKISDIYNDLVFETGFININNSKINFYNWFFVNIWSFDVNQNFSKLFGISKIIESIKVKVTNDKSNLIVYGNFRNDINTQSYLFILSLSDGSIIRKNNKNGILSSDSNLINNINLITIVDNEILATPKKPNTIDSANVINISIIDLNTYVVSKKSFDIGIHKGNEFGEIIAVQKVNGKYVFAIKTIYSVQTNTYKVMISLFLFDKNSLNCTNYFLRSFSSESSIKPNLDNAIFSVSKIKTNSEEKMFITMNYDTTTKNIKPIKNNALSPIVLCICMNEHGLVNSDIVDYANRYNLKVNVSNSVSSHDIAGVLNFVNDESNSKVYAVVLKNNDNKKIAFVPLMENASVANGWMNFNYTSSNNQSLKIFFIPKSLKDSKCFGFVSVDKENSNFITNETKIFSYTLSTNNSSVYTSNIVSNFHNYKFGLSDKEIYEKYKNCWVTEDLKQKIVKDLISSSLFLTNISSNVIDENLSFNVHEGIIKGNVILGASNWWNNSDSKFKRNIDIQFRKPHDYNISFVNQEKIEDYKWDKIIWLKTTRKPSDITKKEIIDYFINQGKYLNLSDDQVDIIDNDLFPQTHSKKQNLIVVKISDNNGTFELNYDLSLLNIPLNSGVQLFGKISHSGFSKESNFLSYDEYLSRNVQKSQYLIIFLTISIVIILVFSFSLILIKKKKITKTKKTKI